MASETTKLISSIRDTLNSTFLSFPFLCDGLRSYKETVRINLHSWLQYIMIKAGIDCNFHAIPEYKIRLDKPLKGIGRKRATRLYRADVGFIKFGGGGMRMRPEVLGIGEVYTMDEAHGAYKSEDLHSMTGGKDTWLTPASKLPYVVESKEFYEFKERFIVIMTVLPENASDIPPWDALKSVQEYDKNFYRAFSSKWKELVDELRKKSADAHLIILKGCRDAELQVEIYP